MGSSSSITSSTPRQKEQELVGTFLVADAKPHGMMSLNIQTWEQALSNGLSAALKGGYSGFVAGVIQVRTHLNEVKRQTQK